ncbi:MAG TPA: glyoxalase, partial [Actinomycetota bacterium]|nr:glyoxalase [Actinomycetota bacterium]
GIRLFTQDAGTDHATLRAGGADVDPEVTRMEIAPPMFALRDPDGNSLILVEGA